MLHHQKVPLFDLLRKTHPSILHNALLQPNLLFYHRRDLQCCLRQYRQRRILPSLHLVFLPQMNPLNVRHNSLLLKNLQYTLQLCQHCPLQRINPHHIPPAELLQDFHLKFQRCTHLLISQRCYLRLFRLNHQLSRHRPRVRRPHHLRHLRQIYPQLPLPSLPRVCQR